MCARAPPRVVASGMSETRAQRLAKSEATARRWFRTLQSAAGTDMSDEVFSVIYRQWLAADRAVVLERES